MNFSLKTLIVLTTWLCLLMASVCVPDAALLRDIVKLLISVTFLIALSLALTTKKHDVRCFCTGFVVVGLGLVLLARFNIVVFVQIRNEIGMLITGGSNRNAEWYYEVRDVVHYGFCQMVGLLSGYVIMRLTAESAASTDE